MLTFLTSHAARKLIPYAVVALALVGAYWYITDAAYDRGVEDTTKRYEAAMRAERERLEDANEKALEAAMRRAGALAAKLERQNAEYAEAMAAAARDPHADRVCLGTDSVRRLSLD